MSYLKNNKELFVIIPLLYWVSVNHMVGIISMCLFIGSLLHSMTRSTPPAKFNLVNGKIIAYRRHIDVDAGISFILEVALEAPYLNQESISLPILSLQTPIIGATVRLQISDNDVTNVCIYQSNFVSQIAANRILFSWVFLLVLGLFFAWMTFPKK